MKDQNSLRGTESIQEFYLDLAQRYQRKQMEHMIRACMNKVSAAITNKKEIEEEIARLTMLQNAYVYAFCDQGIYDMKSDRLFEIEKKKHNGQHSETKAPNLRTATEKAS